MEFLDKIKGLINPEKGKTTVEQNFSYALSRLNCDIKFEDYEKNERRGVFEYQGGNFFARIIGDSQLVNIVYPSIYDGDMSNINNIRSIVNHINSTSIASKMVYSIDTEHHKINVHIILDYISDGSLAKNKMALTELLKSAFYMQRTFYSVIDGMKYPGSGYEEDAEMEKAKLDRIKMMLKEYEVRNQPKSFERDVFNYESAERVSVGDVMEMLLDVKGADITEVKSVGAEAGNSGSYDIKELMKAGVGDATLAVTYNDLSKEKRLRYCTIRITFDHKSEYSVYYRVTACVSPCELDSDNHLGLDDNSPEAGSALIAYDLNSNLKKMNDEYKFMVLDMQDKIRDGKTSELTDEQELMSFLTEESLSYSFYWGATRFRQKRYFEAINYLKEAYGMIKQNYKRGREGIADKVVYMIGFCYMELEKYENAFYYLSNFIDSGSIVYTKLLVDCLIAMGEPRGLFIINAINQSINMSDIEPDDEADDDDYEEEETLPIEEFRLFLKRSYCILLMKTHQWKDAVKRLTELSKIESQKEFAELYLDYIAKNVPSEALNEEE